MTGNSIVRLLGAAAFSLCVTTAVVADEDDWMGPRWGMGMGQMMGGWGMMGGPDAMIDRIDGRLAFMKTELKITEAAKRRLGGPGKGHSKHRRRAQ